jgi:NDP-sugar pyrophosphorylase family protein
MKAMVLAAGVGSRLRPITDSIPKALVEINGTPILEIILRRLEAAGVREVILNLHHLGEQIVEFLKSRQNFGLRIEFSREEELLDTGGGLKKASWFFDDEQPFFLHNVDALTNVNLHQMLQAHHCRNALATLLTQDRLSSRFFLFDSSERLCGWESTEAGKLVWSGIPVPGARRLAFNGIHVVSPRIFPMISEAGRFSINQTYLRLAGEGERILAHHPENFFWRDIGRIGQLEEIRGEVRRGGIQFYPRADG